MRMIGILPKILLAICLSVGSLDLRADEVPSEDSARIPVVDLPVVDLPFNMTDGGFIFPSMRQSLGISTGFYQSVHHAIGGDRPGLGKRLMIAGFDVLTYSLPFGAAWLHEEWHRAVMGHRHIASFNDTWNFPFGAQLIAVSHVEDSELIRLKRDFPADQVRLNSAGMESQLEQNLLIEKRRFFHGTRSWDQGVLWFNHVNVIAYVNTCASGSQADNATDHQNNSDGADIAKRDFTGLDCTAWVYDLFRPEEAYQARGMHPSGVGINRYRRYSDLREEEREFLRTQSVLTFINLADPFLIEKTSFKGSLFGFGERWNWNLRHFLTSFGYSLEGNIFIKDGERNWLFKAHAFANAVRVFPGLSAELSRWPMPGSKQKLTSRVSLWAQPEAQRVKSTVDRLGVLAALEIARPIAPGFEVHAGLEGKSEGWVAGNVYIEPAMSLWTGATVLF